VLTRSTSSLS